MAALGLRLPGLGRAPLWARPVLPLPVPVPLPVPLPVPVLGAWPGPGGRGLAGHNRWSKVRNVKGPRDAQRSRIFQRMAAMLRAAAREGGRDPSVNAALAAVLEQCRAQNVPKATIEHALRTATERPAGDVRLLLGARGPGGALLLLDVLTDNVRRCQATLRTLLGQHGAALASNVQHAFQAVAVVRVSGRGVTLEAALEAAAVAGAQDVLAGEGDEVDELKFLCDPSSLRSVRQGLVAAGLRPLSAAVEFAPTSPLTLAGGQRAAAERLLEAAAEWPEVVRLFHNVRLEWPEEWPEEEGGGGGGEGR